MPVDQSWFTSCSTCICAPQARFVVLMVIITSLSFFNLTCLSVLCQFDLFCFSLLSYQTAFYIGTDYLFFHSLSPLSPGTHPLWLICFLLVVKELRPPFEGSFAMNNLDLKSVKDHCSWENWLISSFQWQNIRYLRVVTNLVGWQVDRESKGASKEKKERQRKEGQNMETCITVLALFFSLKSLSWSNKGWSSLYRGGGITHTRHWSSAHRQWRQVYRCGQTRFCQMKSRWDIVWVWLWT